MTQDQENPFARGFRMVQEANKEAREEQMAWDLHRIATAPVRPPAPPPPTDYTPTLMLCGTILLVALIAALCFLKRKPEGS